MGKLIDSDWLKAQWNEPTNWMDGDQVLHHYTWFKMVLELAPTVDAVTVVRCKDCKWFVDANDECGTCGFFEEARSAIHYCGEGELRGR